MFFNILEFIKKNWLLKNQFSWFELVLELN